MDGSQLRRQRRPSDALACPATTGPSPRWARFVNTNSQPQDNVNEKSLQLGNTGFQQSFTDVLHIGILGIMQSLDKCIEVELGIERSDLA
jgi:hypothetical protein